MFRNIIMVIGWVLVILVAIAELVTFFGLLKRYLYSRKKVCIYMAILALGLFFDAAILSAGRFLGVGSLLMALSKARLIVRAVVIPMILPICAYALELNNTAKRILWILMLVCVGVGVAAVIFTKLESSDLCGILRYAASPETPFWADAITVYMPLGIYAFLIICGFAMIFRGKTLWILLAGLAVAGLTVVGQFTGFTDLIFLFSLFGEMLMLRFFQFYTQKLKKSYL